MCIATEYFKELEDWYRRLSDDFDELRKLQSEVDKELSNKYHEIERSKFNVVQGYKLVKDLQNTLQKRRGIKGEVCKVGDLRNSINTGLGPSLSHIENKFNRSKDRNEEVMREMNVATEAR